MITVQAITSEGATRPATNLSDFPSVLHWSFDGSAYLGYEPGDSLPAVGIQERRDARWEAIKAQRDRLSDQGGYKVTVSGVPKWFHSDGKSKTQQIALARRADKVQAAGGNMSAQFAGNSGFWKTMDGTFVAMTATLAQAVADAAEVQDGAIFAAAEAHRIAMEAAANPVAYDFSTGWPEVFQP